MVKWPNQQDWFIEPVNNDESDVQVQIVDARPSGHFLFLEVVVSWQEGEETVIKLGKDPDQQDWF